MSFAKSWPGCVIYDESILAFLSGIRGIFGKMPIDLIQQDVDLSSLYVDFHTARAGTGACPYTTIAHDGEASLPLRLRGEGTEG